MNRRRPRPEVIVARIYDQPEPPGLRVLVDRLWPRGVARADAPIDEWQREVAPSDALRRWYGHDHDRFAEFARRYRAELDAPPRSELLVELRKLARTQPLILVTATKDALHSHAAVLADVLREP